MPNTQDNLESTLSLLKKLDRDLSAHATDLDERVRKAREAGNGKLAHDLREMAMRSRVSAGVAAYVLRVNEGLSAPSAEVLRMFPRPHLVHSRVTDAEIGVCGGAA